MAISRRIGRAARRNRIKRLIRESFRLNQHRFPEGLDLVVVPRKRSRLTLETISASLCKLVPRAAAACLPRPRGEGEEA
jgi:ribonuclease P protein component